jgi:2-polyprenyl-3-methyl-5-hydroxy-6-metoxy-1,4-benzoquinol methylase
VQDWTQDFFSAVALGAWRRAHSPDITQAEAELLQQALELGDEPKRLLDVPCGDARHAVELARLGHRITAIDSAPDNAARARQHASAAGVTLDFVLGDMRALPERPPFEGAAKPSRGSPLCHRHGHVCRNLARRARSTKLGSGG